MRKPIRVLIAKAGLDGHDRGAIVVANALKNAGMEILYTGRHRSPQEIVRTATEEDVDFIGLSIHSGAHFPICQEIMKLLREQQAEEIRLVVGGFISEDDVEPLMALGVARVFPVGSSTGQIATYLVEAVK